MREFTWLRRSASGVLLALVLAGCAVGPDFVRPAPNAPDWYSNAEAAASAGVEAADEQRPSSNDEFWKAFDDPVLVELVDAALAENHDLRIALSRYDRANALLREAGFDRFPTVT